MDHSDNTRSSATRGSEEVGRHDGNTYHPSNEARSDGREIVRGIPSSSADSATARDESKSGEIAPTTKKRLLPVDRSLGRLATVK